MTTDPKSGPLPRAEGFGHDTPWPVRDVLHVLGLAADHLLGQHGCDCHGWEEAKAARESARTLWEQLGRHAAPAAPDIGGAREIAEPVMSVAEWAAVNWRTQYESACRDAKDLRAALAASERERERLRVDILRRRGAYAVEVERLRAALADIRRMCAKPMRAWETGDVIDSVRADEICEDALAPPVARDGGGESALKMDARDAYVALTAPTPAASPGDETCETPYACSKCGKKLACDAGDCFQPLCDACWNEQLEGTGKRPATGGEEPKCKVCSQRLELIDFGNGVMRMKCITCGGTP